MNWKICINTIFVLLLVCFYSGYMLLCMRPLLVHLAVLPGDVASIARSLIVQPRCALLLQFVNCRCTGLTFE